MTKGTVRLLMLMSLVAVLVYRSGYSQQQAYDAGTRIKDVAALTGLEDVQLIGYGLVVGLAGTGDRTQTIFTTQAIRNMLKNMGIELPDQTMRVQNVAAVMLTATLNPFKRRGTRFDVTVSSLGDARSLEGGTLIFTSLQGPDGQIYASAQGALATGGFDVENRGMTHVKKNHVLVGRIPDGAIVQREYAFNVLDGTDISLSLFAPDFTSAVSMARAINDHFQEKTNKTLIAKALDASTVSLNFGVVARDSIRNYVDLIDFISQVENIRFEVSNQARIVLNERTGTIVAGGEVRIADIAVTHGGIKIEIVNSPEVIEPAPFVIGQPETIANPQRIIEEKDMDVVVLNKTTSVSDLAHALNSLGVAPRDIIAIFQAIKEAGALQGRLIIM
ncbi:MAG: flagellar basal body P-ring protein FlgI [Chitinivibrionales bacterium]|nr:flagellar basal body P-ring protein FlgI [Chitinivibrionales bacterium]